MEDAHACVLDLQPLEEGDEELKPAASDVRISFFGVYDGHGGDKVAIYTGENLHKIIAKQEAFKNKNFEQALKDGFLAIDRAILSGTWQYKLHESVGWTYADGSSAQTLNTRTRCLDAQPLWASLPRTRSTS
jgi:serine/threonine protein phosphatase PrpC